MIFHHYPENIQICKCRKTIQGNLSSYVHNLHCWFDTHQHLQRAMTVQYNYY